MPFQITTAIEKVSQLDKRIRAVQGGTSAAKTASIISVLVDAAQRDTRPTLTSIVSESFPHLKRGAIRDFVSVLEEQDYYDDDRWNRTDFIYTFETGSKLEFFSADQPAKVRGPRRDRLFCNEVNNIPLETFDQLEVRTNQYIFADWNPTNEFWMYTDILPNRDDVDHIILTYKDNEALNPEIVKSIERRQNNKSWWRVYGMGLLGEVEGKIYKEWKIVDEIPHESKLVGYGLDFGYTNDPTSIVAIYYYNGGYILHEVCYQKGLSNKQIADILNAVAKAPVVADAAEPKSIDEIKSYGIVVIPSTKGHGSVSQRIQFVQDQRISVTKSSINVIREYRNYMWDCDINGKILNVPEHEYSHSMDAVGYGLQLRRPAHRPPTYIQPNPAPAMPFEETPDLSQPQDVRPARKPWDRAAPSYQQPNFESSSPAVD